MLFLIILEFLNSKIPELKALIALDLDAPLLVAKNDEVDPRLTI